MALSFDDLRTANVKRCEAAFHQIGAWSPSDWSNAMAGECGEACNITKKILRAETSKDGCVRPEERDTKKLVADLAQELADVVIYADLLAVRCGIDLGGVVREKFNAVSERVGSDVKLC